ncbi:hypothetical protein GCM10025762_10440 [Haloechinothrix salitolerans]
MRGWELCQPAEAGRPSSRGWLSEAGTAAPCEREATSETAKVTELEMLCE